MTIDHEPQLLHDARCTSWKTDNPELCDCRDQQGHTPRTGWADGPLCPFDLETTGPEPLDARIVTATAIRIRPGHDNHVVNWLSDVDGEDIPEGASAVHGISTEHAHTHGRPLAEAVDELRTMLELEWSAGVPVVGHNVAYDLTVLARECERFAMRAFTIAGPVIDSIVLDRGVDKWRRGKRTLTATCQVYGIVLSEEDAHTSDADALASARIAWKIAKRYPDEVGNLALDELMEWQRLAHRDWANGLGQYLRRQGKVDDVSREWPLRSAS